MNELFWVTYVLLWLLVAALAVAVLALYHHFGQMYLNSREGRADQGPAVGQRIATDSAVDLLGVEVTLPVPDRPSLVLFASTTCPICAQLRDHVARIGGERADLRVVVFCEGTSQRVAEWAGDLSAVARVVPDPRRRHALRHNIAGTPVCVAVARDGTAQATAIVNGYERLAELADAAAGTHPNQAQPDHAHPGQAHPGQAHPGHAHPDHRHERVGSGQ